MKLVETIQLKRNKNLRELCHNAKNLYNLGNWYINNWYDIYEEYLNWYDTKWILKTHRIYKKLPAQCSQNVLKYLHLMWKSYFNALKDWSKNRKKYRHRPNPPKYLRKNSEYFVCFNSQHTKLKNNFLYFPKKTNLKPIEIITKKEELQQVRIVPKNDIYNLEIIYNKKEIDLKLDKDRIIAIDIGLNNLLCVVNNIGLKPFYINGRPLKAINNFYNKTKARYQSKKDIQGLESYTKKLQKLERKRNNKIKDYIHHATSILIKYCIINNIGTIIIGRNKLWKQKIDIGKKNNQHFVQIPFFKILNIIKYKAELYNIQYIEISEEYTSLCSFLDNEEIKKHDIYKGKRISRGLFRSSDGRIINADVNGAFNILRKVFPKAINVDGIKGAQLHPLRININTKTILEGIKTS